MNKSLIVLPFVVMALLSAIWTGWIRIGWYLPVSSSAGQHGALMIGSFLSSLIFLERAITFKQKWVLLLPLLNASSGIAFLVDKPLLGQWLLLTGSAGFLAMCTYFIYKYKELYYYVFWAGAFTLLTGYATLLKTHFYSAAVPWWIAFLLYTIVAERLELSRFLAINKRKQYSLLAVLFVLMLSLFLPFHGWGRFIFPLAIVSTAVWLLRYDMAWHSISIKGQHRYSAWLLITGYIWLLVTGLLFFVSDQFAFGYDAALHSFFIGFTFSMIFSHAPIILPAIIKQPIKLYRPVLYVWFALLQLSLLIRVYGDLAGHFQLRKSGGLVNGLAMLLFFLSIGVILRSELTKRKKRLSRIA
jgi:hypothetical protein